MWQNEKDTHYRSATRYLQKLVTVAGHRAAERTRGYHTHLVSLAGIALMRLLRQTPPCAPTERHRPRLTVNQHERAAPRTTNCPPHAFRRRCSRLGGSAINKKLNKRPQVEISRECSAPAQSKTDTSNAAWSARLLVSSADTALLLLQRHCRPAESPVNLLNKKKCEGSTTPQQHLPVQCSSQLEQYNPKTVGPTNHQRESARKSDKRPDIPEASRQAETDLHLAQPGRQVAA